MHHHRKCVRALLAHSKNAPCQFFSTRTFHTSNRLRNQFPPVRFGAQPQVQRLGWKDESRPVRWTAYLAALTTVAFLGFRVYYTSEPDELTHRRRFNLAPRIPAGFLLASTRAITLQKLGLRPETNIYQPPYALPDDDERVVFAREVLDKIVLANGLQHLGFRLFLIDSPNQCNKQKQELTTDIVIYTGELTPDSTFGASTISVKLAERVLQPGIEQMHEGLALIAGVVPAIMWLCVLVGVRSRTGRLIPLAPICSYVALVHGEMPMGSRQMLREREVDSLALRFMDKARYDPGELMSVLRFWADNGEANLKNLRGFQTPEDLNLLTVWTEEHNRRHRNVTELLRELFPERRWVPLPWGTTPVISGTDSEPDPSGDTDEVAYNKWIEEQEKKRIEERKGSDSSGSNGDDSDPEK